MKPSRFFRLAIRRLMPAVLLAAGIAMSFAQGEPPAQGPRPGQSVSITPTATNSMGDLGGKFFGHAPDPAKTRHYYIAAEPELWNFAPDGIDPVCGKIFPQSLLLNRVSWKIRYVQYADPDFTARVLPDPRLGIMGPVLRGCTGEYLAVTVINRSWRPISMHPHGVRYDKDSEGSYYNPAPGIGAAIAPGGRFTYVWHLDEGAGPGPEEPSSKAWIYHSHVAGDEEINLGLFGFIVVTDPKRARPDGTPSDVDREMAAAFLIFDESNLPDQDNDEPDERPANQPTGPVHRAWAEVQQFKEEGERHTINGRTFGNLKGLEMNEGERVRWYLFGLGSEKDFHTAHWHGQRLVEDGRRRTDVVELLPGSMKIADMRADTLGQWLFHCHVGEHMSEGMFARFTVHAKDAALISREADKAFFGMPQSLATLRFQSAELDQSDSANREVNLVGQLTVSDPFPLASNKFTVKVGEKSVSLQPDASGLCVNPEAILLVKNGSSIGVVSGGTMNFELTLKGAVWIEELRKAGVLDGDTLTQKPRMRIQIEAGSARHSAECELKMAR